MWKRPHDGLYQVRENAKKLAITLIFLRFWPCNIIAHWVANASHRGTS
jgi:hypothetical protein